MNDRNRPRARDVPEDDRVVEEVDTPEGIGPHLRYPPDRFPLSHNGIAGSIDRHT